MFRRFYPASPRPGKGCVSFPLMVYLRQATRQVRLDGRRLSMHKDTKWAGKIIALQDGEGKWGCFHSLSRSSDASMTTEQALRRLKILGFTIEDACIQKAVGYMNDCLTRKKEIPDRKEKIQDWEVFSDLMLAAWIRAFVQDNAPANRVAQKWAEVIAAGFETGRFDSGRYVDAYAKVIRLPPKGARILGCTSFYPVSLAAGCLDRKTEAAYTSHLIRHDGGIYYIYEQKISQLPEAFQSKKASRFLAAVELLSEYETGREQLSYVIPWLHQNKNPNGKWDMGRAVNDKIYFPLSDSWRKAETREADCTERIGKLLRKLETY